MLFTPLQCVVGKSQPRPLRFGATYIPWVIKIDVLLYITHENTCVLFKDEKCKSG